MDGASSTTRVEALKIAKYIGCSGAHETPKGWMPCADMETLTRISRRAEKKMLETRPARKRRRKGRRSSDGWEDLNERPVQGIETTPEGSLVSGTTMTKAAKKPCPPATTSIAVNLRNRQKAIKDAKYGPLNPNEPNVDYWKNLADDWNVSTAEAKKQTCGNCAAFVKTPEMLSCINKGIGPDKDSWSVVKAGDLGYCEFFDFKCASKRTCSAWVVGGPITESNEQETKALSSRRVRSSDPDVFSSPESARARSRQLGCIGIRRYASTENEDVWMPCTNESDYRRAQGTSPQGRMDVAKRQMREMRLAIGKMKKKSLGAKTPAPPKDRITGSKRNAVGTAASRTSSAKIEFSPAVTASIRNAAMRHNNRMRELSKPSWTQTDANTLKAVYQRGAGAYSTSHRPNVTRGQWAMGRVRAFLWMLEHGKPKKLSYLGDTDLLPRSHPFKRASKTAEGLRKAADFDALEEKGLGRWLRRNTQRGGRALNVSKAKRRIEKPEYDGDSDGFIMNPLTGRDDLPAPKTPDSTSPRMRTIISPARGRGREKPSPYALISFSRVRPGDDDNQRRGNPPEITDRSGMTWVRDDLALLVGSDWVSSADVRNIEPVPDGIFMPLRLWNGIPAITREYLMSEIEEGIAPRRSDLTREEWNSLITESAESLLSDLGFLIRSDGDTDAWDAYFMLTQEERDAYNRSRLAEDPAYLSPDELLGRIQSAGSDESASDAMRQMFNRARRSKDGETSADDDPFSSTRALLSPATRFFYDSWRDRREKRRNNPSSSLVSGPRLDDHEMWLWIAAAQMDVQDSIQDEKNKPGYSPVDGISDRSIHAAIFDALVLEAPNIAGTDDENIARMILEDINGVSMSNNPAALARELDLHEIAPDEVEELNKAFAAGYSPRMIDPKWSSIPENSSEFDDLPAWYKFMRRSYYGYASTVPDEVPNDPRNPDFRPYLDRNSQVIRDAGLDIDEDPADMAARSAQRLRNQIEADLINDPEASGGLRPLSEVYSGSNEQMIDAFLNDITAWFDSMWQKYVDTRTDEFAALTLPQEFRLQDLIFLFGKNALPPNLQTMGFGEAIPTTQPPFEELSGLSTDVIPGMLALLLSSTLQRNFSAAMRAQ